MVKLYSNDCPRCKVLEKKLNQKNIMFEKITDFEPDVLFNQGYVMLPVMQVDDIMYDYKDAVQYIQNI